MVITSGYNRKTVEWDRCSLQASKQDVEALVEYIYTTLGMDLDYILPFAGIPENSREIDGLDDRSDLAHRMMTVNLLRIMGAVKNKKASCQVILPLSPCLATMDCILNRRSLLEHCPGV